MFHSCRPLAIPARTDNHDKVLIYMDVSNVLIKFDSGKQLTIDGENRTMDVSIATMHFDDIVVSI